MSDTVSGFIVPKALFSVFNVKLPNAPCQVSPAPIYSGPNAGNYFVNAALFTSCPEWEAALPAAQALATENGLSLTPVDVLLTDLQNPNSRTFP